jgi:acyl dehydratase
VSAHLRAGEEFIAAPYLLDAHAAKLYGEAIEGPARQSTHRGIHDDKEAARAAGFVAPIAAGEQTIAVVAQFLAERFGARFMQGGRLEVSLIKAVLFGDTLTSRAKVEQVEKTHARLKIRVENQRGENVLVGIAMIRTSDS